jgi:hydroxyacylglutathione hydrolase
MLFERIESEGLAHYSYLIGDQGQAVVIDPRRDCGVYVDAAERSGFHIATILETHRNEDYAIGSGELASRTGAEIWHADAQLDYQYGQPVEDGQTWSVGRLEVRALHTPGHTPGSMSYLLHDPDGTPWMVFTGDALFAGDVGRMDLLGADRLEEMAHALYASLFETLLPLGDEAAAQSQAAGCLGAGLRRYVRPDAGAPALLPADGAVERRGAAAAGRTAHPDPAQPR